MNMWLERMWTEHVEAVIAGTADLPGMSLCSYVMRSDMLGAAKVGRTLRPPQRRLETIRREGRIPDLVLVRITHDGGLLEDAAYVLFEGARADLPYNHKHAGWTEWFWLGRNDTFDRLATIEQMYP